MIRYGAEEESGNKDDNVQKKRLDDLLTKAQKRKEKALQSASAEPQDVPTKKKKLKATRKDVVKESSTVNEEENPDEKASVEPSLEAATKSETEIKTNEASQQPDGFTVIGRDQFKKIKEVRLFFTHHVKLSINSKTFIFKKAKGVLPKWLAQPTLIAVDMKNLDYGIDNLKGLSPLLINNLKASGLVNVFPGMFLSNVKLPCGFMITNYISVQREVIPWLLKEYRNSLTGYWPRDLCVSAPTGSGKTLAFALPLIQVSIF